MNLVSEHNLQRAHIAGLLLLAVCIILYAFTGNLILLAIPFGLLFTILMLVNWKTAFWIMLFFVPCSIQVWFLNDTLSTSLPDEPMMWLFLLMTVVLIAGKPTVIPKWFWRNSLSLVVLLQYIWLIVTVIYSQEPFYSLKFLLAKTWFLAAFFLVPVLVIREKKDFRKAAILLIVPGTIFTLIVFTKHYLLGFSFEKIQAAVRYLFYNHVDYSTFLSMLLPVLCIAFVLSRGRGLFLRCFLAGLILFYLLALNLAYARAAVLAVVFSFGILLAIRLRLVNLVMPVFYGLLILAVSFLVKNNKFIDYRPDFAHTYMRTNFKEHLEATFKGTDMSSMERVYRWIAAVRMSTDEPLKGYGPNSFYNYYKPYTVTSFVTYVSRNPEKSTTHNYFLLMLVEQGWPAMLLYALLVALFFAKAQRVYYRHKDRFYKNCTLAVAMVFAACFINNFFSELIETHKIGSLFYLSIALLIVLDHKSKVLEEEGQSAAAPVRAE